MPPDRELADKRPHREAGPHLFDRFEMAGASIVVGVV
jgi:hypothetical protein